MEPALPPRIVLIDGTCIFCNRLVALILRRDRKKLFSFAHLQGALGQRVLARHGRAGDIDGVYLLVDGGTDRERLLVDGEAGRAIWPELFWLANVLKLVPLFVLDLQYRLFAKVRYRLFGQADACIVPSAEDRARLVEDPA